MIKNFKQKSLEEYFTKNIKKGLDAKDLSKISRILDRLDTATVVTDMNISGWDFHGLKGNRKGETVRSASEQSTARELPRSRHIPHRRRLAFPPDCFPFHAAKGNRKGETVRKPNCRKAMIQRGATVCIAVANVARTEQIRCDNVKHSKK